MNKTYFRIEVSDTTGDKPIQLHRPISGQIALKSIEFTVGWYNITAGDKFSVKKQETIAPALIPAGLYNFEAFKNYFNGLKLKETELSTSRTTGKLTIVPPERSKLKFSKKIADMLGIGTDWIDGKVTGERPINFAPVKSLHVHLGELEKSTNFYGGKNTTFDSSLLEIVSIGDGKFGTHVVHNFNNPTWKALNGSVLTLTPSVCDTLGAPVKNKFAFALNFVVESS